MRPSPVRAKRSLTFKTTYESGRCRLGDLQDFKVLIIDDEPEQLKLAKRSFSWAKAKIFTAASGAEGLQKLYTHRPDLIILDLVMPEMDGLEVCRRIRHLTKTPIIILTALVNDTEMIRSLKSGADDYITKPFNPFVLISRAEALVRRSTSTGKSTKQDVYSDGYLTIEQDRPRLLVEGKAFDLTTKEYHLLLHLVQNANRAVTFQSILEHVWGWEYWNHTEFVHVYISRLRQKLEQDPRHPRYLISERGLGYRFERQDAT